MQLDKSIPKTAAVVPRETTRVANVFNISSDEDEVATSPAVAARTQRRPLPVVASKAPSTTSGTSNMAFAQRLVMSPTERAQLVAERRQRELNMQRQMRAKSNVTIKSPSTTTSTNWLRDGVSKVLASCHIQSLGFPSSMLYIICRIESTLLLHPRCNRRRRSARTIFMI